MALETKVGFQFIGHQLEVGRLLEGEELFEEGDGFRGPARPVIAAGELGGEAGAFRSGSGCGAGKGGCG